jgi:hypothetical protein
VQPGRGLEPDPPGTKHDVSAEAIQRYQQQERHRGQRKQEPKSGGDRRQREYVVTDVAGEDGIYGPERRSMNCAQNQIPRRGEGQAGQQAQRQGNRQGKPPHCPGYVQPRRLGAQLKHEGIRDNATLRRSEIQVQHTGCETASRQEEQQPRGQLPGKHDLVADLLKPPPVGEQPDQGGQEEQRRTRGDQKKRRQTASDHRSSLCQG